MADPTQRFSSRVENYVKFRPSYPPQVLEVLARECGLRPGTRVAEGPGVVEDPGVAEGSVVADVGSGTGISTELFLRHGCEVWAVEPNADMRAAAERWLHGRPGFHSVDARAEATTLPAASVDFVVAGQAFHWFDRPAARREFQRILRPGGWVVLLWNDRDTESTRFLVEYEAFLHRFATDYAQVDHKLIDANVLAEFFAPGGCAFRPLPNRQDFDVQALQGRLLSSSYVPDVGQPNYEPMLVALRDLFDRHQEQGQVTFLYTTTLYFGRLTGSGSLF